MSREVEQLNRRLLRARDAMDRGYAEPLDVRAVAAVARLSEAHFIRSFRACFGETPHRDLQRRRVERAMFLLRETDRSVTVSASTSGSPASGPSAGRSATSSASHPSAYRDGHAPIEAPHCLQMAATRPRVAAEASRSDRAVSEKPWPRRLASLVPSQSLDKETVR